MKRHTKILCFVFLFVFGLSAVAEAGLFHCRRAQVRQSVPGGMHAVRRLVEIATAGERRRKRQLPTRRETAPEPSPAGAWYGVNRNGELAEGAGKQSV